MVIEKRNGKIENFNKEKVLNAILRAMKSTDINDTDFALKITDSIEVLVKDKNRITVEQIQDIVEKKLMCSKYKDVAKNYITYRNERTKTRDKNKQLYKKTKQILNCTNITNDNANVDQYSFSGKENRIGSEFQKQYSKDELLTERVRNAFDEGYIYLHDFDKYAIGSHNCLYADVAKLLREGFSTRNGDVRPANSINTAFQLIAVIFQIQSQVQYGGVASAHIDYDIAPYVRKSFAKHYYVGVEYLEDYRIKGIILADTSIEDDRYKTWYPKAYNYAWDMTYKEGMQAAQALYHNLNTLESRAGAQVPFTSINFGRDTSREGQLVTEWLLKASIEGIGKHHKTSIFPISIFQYKKGVNDKPGTPNYYLKKLAIESMTKRIYPNWVNCDYSQHQEDENDIDTIAARMGCRTSIGKDRHGLGYKQVGRGNVAPTTIILPQIGIEYGICQGKRDKADIEGFWRSLEYYLDVTKESLVNRFTHVSNQSPKSAPFMYDNGTIADVENCKDNVYHALKHGTLAIGFIGIAEMCEALFGKNHANDKEVYDFAISVVKHIYDYCKSASEEYNLNFSCYATPAEGLCETAAINLRNKYGKIKNVTDKEYITNSTHVPVWKQVSMYEKLKLEQPFTYYETGGCITYIEVDSSLSKNPEGVEKIIDTAMEMDVPYLAINFPIDTCLECGYQGDINDVCPQDGGTNIEHLARVTGYLSTDVSNFNKGKQNEVKDRVKHIKKIDFGGDVI